ncbi:hypothetical protein MYX19_04905, partial [Nitrospinae bacterium AH-259-F20]|nr:hypothetical protein [Nitrospinae bacterium AH-259-F20]
MDSFGNYEVDPNGYKEINSGWGAIVANEDPNVPAFREYVLFFHDDLGNNKIKGLIEENPRAISYRTEPFSDIFNSRKDGTRPRTDGDQPFTVNDRSLAYSAYTYGDSSTPHPRFYVGDPMRYRIVHGGTGDQFHVFHHHAHRWRFQPNIQEKEAKNGKPNLTNPSKWGRPQFPEQPDVTTSTSLRIDSQTLGPGETFDVFIEGGAGGVQRTVGDVLVHCHIIDHVTQGMWTYARIYNTLQRRTTYQPGLAPLPDRVDKDSRPPIAVDSATLAKNVRAGNGPVPVNGPLAGKRLTSVNNELLLYIRAQLPTPGKPKCDEWADDRGDREGGGTKINRANVWNWTTVEDQNGDSIFLGEPYDARCDGKAPAVNFADGFPTFGEGIGVDRKEELNGGPLREPKLLFNPKDGRLAYPFLLPHAGRRPPFAPKHKLVRPEKPGGKYKVINDPLHQGTAYLGPTFGRNDPGYPLGVSTGSGLVPEEAEQARANVKHYDIVALQLLIDYATFSGAMVDPNEFGTRISGEAVGAGQGGRKIVFTGIDGDTSSWHATING